MTLHFTAGWGSISDPNSNTPGVLLVPGDFGIQYINAGNEVIRLRSVTLSATMGLVAGSNPVNGEIGLSILICPAPQAASVQVPQPIPAGLFVPANVLAFPQMVGIRQTRSILMFAAVLSIPSASQLAGGNGRGVMAQQFLFAEHEIIALPTQQIVIAASAPFDVTGVTNNGGTVNLSSLGWDDSILSREGLHDLNSGALARFGVPRVPGRSFPPFVDVP